MKKVMIVDDERDVTDLFEGILCDHFKVIKAYSGREALKKFEVEKPDLVLLDILMPGMNGWEVLEKIKQTPGLKDVPVILLTAVKPDFNMLETGIENYVVKPVARNRLICSVHETLNAGDKIQEFGKIALGHGVKRELVEEFNEKARLLQTSSRLLILLKQIYTREAFANESSISESNKNMLRSMETSIRMQRLQIYKLAGEIEKHFTQEEFLAILRGNESSSNSGIP